eukprot:495013-Amphidinium_carterae.1
MVLLCVKSEFADNFEKSFKQFNSTVGVRTIAASAKTKIRTHWKLGASTHLKILCPTPLNRSSLDTYGTFQVPKLHDTSPKSLLAAFVRRQSVVCYVVTTLLFAAVLAWEEKGSICEHALLLDL